MAWWNRLFKKKEPIQQEEDWEQLVYTRNGVNFDEEDQRKRYIVNCLEQISEASKEIDLLTGEYTLVTSYLTDTDEIEALPAEQREEVNRVAGKLAGLEQERSRYREKKNRMRDADFYAIRKRENEIEEGIQKIRDGEKYGNLIRQDLHRLDGERHAYEYRRNELENLMNNQRGMAVIFLTALIVCVIMLVILQYAFEMDVYVGLFLAVGAGAVAISYVCIRYMDAGRELQRVEKTINKIIEQTGVKIDITDDGNVSICGTDAASMDEARKLIYIIVTDFEAGQVLEGTVISIKEFGAFVEFAPGKEGMVHISKISKERVNHVEDVLTLGDKVKVVCLGKDKMGRFSFSMKDVAE